MPRETTRRRRLARASLLIVFAAAMSSGCGPAAPSAGNPASAPPAGESLDASGPLDPALAALGVDVVAAVSAGKFDRLRKYLPADESERATRAESVFARELERARVDMRAGKATHCATVLVERTRSGGELASRLHVSARREGMPSEFQFVVRVREIESSPGVRLDEPFLTYTGPTCTGVVVRDAHRDGVRIALDWDSARRTIVPTLDGRAYPDLPSAIRDCDDVRRGRRPAGAPLVPAILDYDRRIPAADAYAFARKLTAPVEIVMRE